MTNVTAPVGAPNMPPQMPAESGVADLPGASLFYWDTGGDGVPVVLSHANTGSALVWGYQQPVLANAGYRVIGYSRRGHYGSALGNPDDMGTGAGDLANLLDFLAIDKAHIIGTALGGIVAVDFAAAFPGRIQSAVLACSLLGVTDDDYRAISNGLRPAGFDDMPPDFREIGPSYRAANRPGVEAWLELERQSLSEGVRKRQGFETKITWNTLENMKVPTLLITGDADLYTPPAVLDMFAARIPNNEKQVIPGAGHSAYWEQPQAFNAAVLAFLTKHR